jgi:hypothetical protein
MLSCELRAVHKLEPHHGVTEKSKFMIPSLIMQQRLDNEPMKMFPA